MQKNEFKIITTKDYKFIPKNAFLVKDNLGYLYCAKVGVQWYMNSKKSEDIGEDEGKVVKEIIKHMKLELKNIDK